MKIEIYDLKGKKSEIRPTYEESDILTGELREFADKNWRENHKGWKSSYIPVASKLEITEDDKFILHAGYSRYAHQFGAIKAILDRKEFAPLAVNGLSVSTCVVTKDNKVIIPRRSDKMKHAPLAYNTPAGWMSSMNIDKSDCENPQFISDLRLYNTLWQAANEFKEELKIEASTAYISIDPMALIRGHDVSFNWTLQYSAILKSEAKNIIGKILEDQEEFAAGRKEHDKVAAVPITSLETLLRNQPELQKEDKKTFQPNDVTELILVDDTIGALYNEFCKKDDSERKLLDYLGDNGIEIEYLPVEVGIYPQSI